MPTDLLPCTGLATATDGHRAHADRHICVWICEQPRELRPALFCGLAKIEHDPEVRAVVACEHNCRDDIALVLMDYVRYVLTDVLDQARDGVGELWNGMTTVEHWFCSMFTTDNHTQVLTNEPRRLCGLLAHQLRNAHEQMKRQPDA